MPTNSNNETISAHDEGEDLPRMASSVAPEQVVAEGNEPDMRAVCDALGFDPSNHHNALKCPYCNPQRLDFAATLAAPSAGDQINETFELWALKRGWDVTSKADGRPSDYTVGIAREAWNAALAQPAPVQAGAQQAVADTDYAEGLIDQCAQDWYDWQRNGTDDDRAAWIASRKAAIEYFARALAAPTQAGAGDAAMLQGVEALLHEACAHWDADREFKVGKILLALIGHNKGYDKRSDAFRAALKGASPSEGDA